MLYVYFNLEPSQDEAAIAKEKDSVSAVMNAETKLSRAVRGPAGNKERRAETRKRKRAARKKENKRNVKKGNKHTRKTKRRKRNKRRGKGRKRSRSRKANRKRGSRKKRKKRKGDGSKRSRKLSSKKRKLQRKQARRARKRARRRENRQTVNCTACVLKISDYALLYVRQASNRLKQIKRMESFDKIIRNKKNKSSNFEGPYSLLLAALGGDVRSPKCDGKNITTRSGNNVSKERPKKRLKFPTCPKQ